jgi:hypothetical protein
MTDSPITTEHIDTETPALVVATPDVAPEPEPEPVEVETEDEPATGETEAPEPETEPT